MDKGKVVEKQLEDTHLGELRRLNGISDHLGGIVTLWRWKKITQLSHKIGVAQNGVKYLST